MTAERLSNQINTMFSGLTFESQRHLYFWHGTRVPKSVSGLVREHAEEFNPSNEMMMACVKKYNREHGENITEHELRHKWQTINQQACELGTETHDFLERYDGLQTPRTPQQKAGVKFLKDYLVDYEIISKELRMYSERYRYAGTCDLLLRHRKTGLLILVDYKTNKDIFKTYSFLKPPFSYLESHPYNEYQLQLSYYQLMLEEIGITISDRLLVHLRADETYRVFELVDFTKHLSEHLQNKIAA